MKNVSLTRNKSYKLTSLSDLEQEKSAPSGGVTQEGSRMSGTFLTGNLSHNLAGGAAPAKGITQSSGMIGVSMTGTSLINQ